MNRGGKEDGEGRRPAKGERSALLRKPITVSPSFFFCLIFSLVHFSQLAIVPAGLKTKVGVEGSGEEGGKRNKAKHTSSKYYAAQKASDRYILRSRFLLRSLSGCADLSAALPGFTNASPVTRVFRHFAFPRFCLFSATSRSPVFVFFSASFTGRPAQRGIGRGKCFNLDSPPPPPL